MSTHFVFQPEPASFLTFEAALEAMKRGDWMTRDGWNGKGLSASLAHAPGFQPFFAMRRDNAPPQPLQPWLPSCTDLLANDWRMA